MAIQKKKLARRGELLNKRQDIKYICSQVIPVNRSHSGAIHWAVRKVEQVSTVHIINNGIQVA